MGEVSRDARLPDRTKRSLAIGVRLRDRWFTVFRTPIVARYA